MIQVSGLVWLLIRIRREDMLSWVMGKDNTRAILANEPHDRLAGSFVIGEVPIGETQKLDCLNAQHFAGHALLLFACKHQVSIYQAGNLATSRAVGNGEPSVCLALLSPKLSGAR